MSGLLDSFDKSRNVKSPIPEMAGKDSPPGSPTSTLSLDDADGKKSLRKVVIARKPKLVSIFLLLILIPVQFICSDSQIRFYSMIYYQLR